MMLFRAKPKTGKEAIYGTGNEIEMTTSLLEEGGSSGSASGGNSPKGSRYQPPVVPPENNSVRQPHVVKQGGQGTQIYGKGSKVELTTRPSKDGINISRSSSDAGGSSSCSSSPYRPPVDHTDNISERHSRVIKSGNQGIQTLGETRTQYLDEAMKVLQNHPPISDERSYNKKWLKEQESHTQAVRQLKELASFADEQTTDDHLKLLQSNHPDKKKLIAQADKLKVGLTGAKRWTSKLAFENFVPGTTGKAKDKKKAEIKEEQVGVKKHMKNHRP
jgi:hypothetical protein